MSVKPGSSLSIRYQPVHPTTIPVGQADQAGGLDTEMTRRRQLCGSDFHYLCSVCHTLYARRYLPYIVISGMRATLHSCFIRCRSRSLPTALFRGDGVNQVPRVWTRHSHCFVPAPRPSTALAKRHNQRWAGKGVFLTTIPDFFHATCHADHAQPEWISGYAKHTAKTDRLVDLLALGLSSVPLTQRPGWI